MKVATLFFCVIAVFLSSCTNDEPLLVSKALPEGSLTQPRGLFVDDDKIVVVDGQPSSKVFLFNPKTLALTATVDPIALADKKFKLTPGQAIDLSTHADFLMLSCYSHLYKYNYRGNLISDHDIPPTSSEYAAFGDRLIRKNQVTENYVKYQTLELCDHDLGEVQEIVRVLAPATRGDLDVLSHNLKYQIYRNRLYVSGRSDDFRIDVYDLTGALVDSISIEYERVVLEQDHKDQVYSYYESHPAYRSGSFELINSRLIFPERLPAIKYFRIADDQICVMTYQQTFDSNECVLLDLAGKILARAPVVFRANNLMLPVPFSYYDGRIYQLIQSRAANVWDLRSYKIVIEPIS